MNFTLNNNDISIVTYIIKIFFLSISTCYTFFKILNNKNINILRKIILIILIFSTSIICTIIKYKTDSYTSIIFLIMLLTSIIYYIVNNNDNVTLANTLLVVLISLSINYVIFFITIIISFIPNIILHINNDYISLLIMIIIHSFLLLSLFKIKRFKYGFSFFNNRTKNDFIDLIILDISVIILLAYNILSNLNIFLRRKLFFSFIAFSIIMFITIRKAFVTYYKHKLLVSELEETKTELENKNKEIEKLEAENLNFSKISHSIAHKQKSLEHKLNQLMLNNEISPELDISNKVKELSNQCFNNVNTTELPKTDIEQIDDMLSFMQDECTKNNIDFEIKLNGNIYHMINNYIDKNDLEILLADHIKNAIIAINHSDNINRSILVKLGMIDGYYGIYVYDSGIEFEIDTLINLGEKPSSTHLDDDGSGIGFLNTFDTLSKCQASIIINEINPPSKENYTKFIAIIFNNKNEYKISSYRSEKIKNVNKRKDLIIEN